MPKRSLEIVLLALIFLAVGIVLMLFVGPFLWMLGWPS
jgi:type IV secretory pathway VirB3-like protein